MLCQDQLVRASDTKHFDADHFRSDDDCMPAVHSKRIDRLQPGYRLSRGVEVGTVVSHVLHCPTRLRSTEYISFRLALVLQRQESLAVDAPFSKSAQRCFGQSQSVLCVACAVAYCLGQGLARGDGNYGCHERLLC